MATVGYVRVNPHARDVDHEIELLHAAECERVFVDRCSGLEPHRPQLRAALNYLTSDDELVVTGWHRLSRSTEQLIELTTELRERGVTLRVLS